MTNHNSATPRSGTILNHFRRSTPPPSLCQPNQPKILHFLTRHKTTRAYTRTSTHTRTPPDPFLFREHKIYRPPPNAPCPIDPCTEVVAEAAAVEEDSVVGGAVVDVVAVRIMVLAATSSRRSGPRRRTFSTCLNTWTSKSPSSSMAVARVTHFQSTDASSDAFPACISSLLGKEAKPC